VARGSGLDDRQILVTELAAAGNRPRPGGAPRNILPAILSSDLSEMLAKMVRKIGLSILNEHS
jgi:hypothetical protein